MELIDSPSVKCMMEEIESLFKKYADEENSIEVDFEMKGTINMIWKTTMEDKKLRYSLEKTLLRLDQDPEGPDRIATAPINLRIKVRSTKLWKKYLPQ